MKCQCSSPCFFDNQSSDCERFEIHWVTPVNQQSYDPFSKKKKKIQKFRRHYMAHDTKEIFGSIHNFLDFSNWQLTEWDFFFKNGKIFTTLV